MMQVSWNRSSSYPEFQGLVYRYLRDVAAA
jgi:hypothetical protein